MADVPQAHPIDEESIEAPGRVPAERVILLFRMKQVRLVRHRDVYVLRQMGSRKIN